MNNKSSIYVKVSTLGDCEELTKIAHSWENIKEHGGEDHKQDYIYKCLTEGDLPPIDNASIENYEIKTVYELKTNKIIGYFDCYKGYPDSNTLWVSMVVIDKSHRGRGYGQEVVKLLLKEASSLQMQRVCIGVYLKNWPALRFWVKAGFDKITGVYGDKEYGIDKFSTIALEYKL